MKVRIYGYAGLTRMKVLGAAQFSSDSVFNLQQPYLWSQTLTTSGVTPVASVAGTINGGGPDVTDILRIEVPDGNTIRYEVNPPGRPGGTVSANAESPLLTGRDQLKFGSQWTISIIDASGT